MMKLFKPNTPRRQHGGWDVTFKTKVSIPDMVERLNSFIESAHPQHVVETLDLRTFFAQNNVRCGSCWSSGRLEARSFRRSPVDPLQRSFHVMVVCTNCQANRNMMLVTPHLPPGETREYVLDALARDLRDHGWCTT